MDYRDENGYYYSDDETPVPRLRGKMAPKSASQPTPRPTSRKSASTKSTMPKSPAPKSPTPKPPTPTSQAATSSSATTKRKTSSAVENRVKKTEKKKRRRKIIKRVIISMFVAFFIGAIVIGGVLMGMYVAIKREVDDLIDTTNMTDVFEADLPGLQNGLHPAFLLEGKNFVKSYIYYENEDAEIVELKELSSKDNIWVNSEDISQNMKDAIVSIEDERFYEHNGMDFKRTGGAILNFMLSKVGIGKASYGGSTITQQVIKNITQEKDKTAFRKVKEIMRAIAFEERLTKDQILTIYLNIVYFANGCYGVEAAANKYFDKTAAELNIAEAATIAGITQRPTKFDPYVNPKDTLTKRNTVLDKMYELKKITKEEYEQARNSKLNVIKKEVPVEETINSYFEDQLINDVIADLKSEHGYSEEFAKQQIYNGGLKIYSTLDPKIQQILEDFYENPANFPNDSIQSAITVIDPYTGEIKGIVGGVGKKSANFVFNRATQSRRQPGSALKPLSAYAPALDLGKNERITASDIFTDEPLTIGSDNWSVKNAYSGYKGDLPLREAIGRSTNTIAVQLVEKVGRNNSYNYLKNNFNLSDITPDDNNYSSLALGGLTKGVSTTEMAGAYASFVNSGGYIEPHTYTKVVDSEGEILLEKDQKPTQAIKATTAYIMSDLLLAPVNEAYGTAKAAKLPNIDTYGKTGTTNDNFDKWFVGYTPYYVAAVWTGYDTPKTVSASPNPSVTTWTTVMKQIHEDLAPKKLKKPSDIVKSDICTVSGDLAKSSCDEITTYFVSGDQPVKFCKGHYSIHRPKATPKPTPTPTPTPTPDIEDVEDIEDIIQDIDDSLSTTKPPKPDDDSVEDINPTQPPQVTKVPKPTESPEDDSSEEDFDSADISEAE